MRIVSLVPSLTELLCDLGLRDLLVGCTKFCVHPTDLRTSITVVGGTKNVRVDVVRELAPTLVIATREENVREQVEEIGQFAEVLLLDVVDLTSAEITIKLLGKRFDRKAQARSIITANRQAIAQLRRPARGRALYLIWRDPHMSVGADTYIHSMLDALGYENACADRTRYPALSATEIRALAPEHILLSSEPYPFKHLHLAEYQALCPTAKVELVDGELYSWYGSRLGKLGTGVTAKPN